LNVKLFYSGTEPKLATRLRVTTTKTITTS